MDEMTSLLAQYGLVLVVANVLIHQAGVPLTAAPLLVLTGALVQQGQIAPVPLLAVAVAGSLAGDIPWYFAGRRYGYPILNALCRVAIEPDSCVKQTENIFERWGARSLLVAKFIPGFSTVAPPLAGTMRLGVGAFVAYSAGGAALWAGVAIGAGMIFHAEVDRALAWLESSGPGALAAIAVVVLAYAALKWVQRWLLIRALRAARISVKGLRELLDGGAAMVILDVRSATARKLDPRRIPGAIVVDIDDPGRNLAGVPPEREIVVYCT
jgi:membrane protein DedA with SNARE-associated domain